MSFKFVLPLLLLFCCHGHAAVEGGGQSRKLISIAVGQLREHQVTSREVNMNFFVESVLFGKKDKKIPTQFYNLKSNEFSREVTAVLLEWVVYLESKGFDGFVTSDEEQKANEKTFLKVVKDNPLWQSLGVHSNELQELISRKLSSKKFVKFKIDTSVVPTTEDEARAYFEENRVKFGSLPFEKFKDNIVSFLEKKQVDRRIKDWFEVLQSKYKVRNFLGEIEIL